MTNTYLHQLTGAVPPDVDWVAGLQTKDQRIIAACYDRYAPALYGFILKSIPEQESACQVLSAAFLHIIKAINQYPASGLQWFTWMLRLTQEEISNQTHGSALLQPPDNDLFTGPA